MQKKDFAFNPKEIRKIAAFKINYIYNGEKTEITEPTRNRFYYAKNKDFDVVAGDAHNYKYKDGYVFVKNFSDGVYLAKAANLHYKVFYNKAVIKTINERLFTFPRDRNEDIYYIGDFDIVWDSKIDEGTSIFNVEGLDNYPNFKDDKGKLTIKSHRNFKDFAEFMKKNFPDVTFVDASQGTSINAKK